MKKLECAAHDKLFIIQKGPVTQCNFSCNLQWNSTLGRCKIGKYMFPCITVCQYIFNIPKICPKFLHLLRVELRIVLQVARKIAPCDRALKRNDVLEHRPIYVLTSEIITTLNTASEYKRLCIVINCCIIYKLIDWIIFSFLSILTNF